MAERRFSEPRVHGRGTGSDSVDQLGQQQQDYWQTNGGRDTQDRVFALSYAEAYQYFGIAYKDDSHQEACAAPTDYASAKGVRSAFVSYAPDGITGGCGRPDGRSRWRPLSPAPARSIAPASS